LIDVKTFLPPEVVSYPLFNKICDIINNKVSFEEIDIVGSKYTNIDIDMDIVKEKIVEKGFNYLLPLFEGDKEKLQKLNLFLPIIKEYKGHRDGYELILKLLDLKYTLTEWWEAVPNFAPYAFDLQVKLKLEDVKANIINNFKDFTRNYVYAYLRTLNISFEAEANFYILAGMSLKRDGDISGILFDKAVTSTPIGMYSAIITKIKYV